MVRAIVRNETLRQEQDDGQADEVERGADIARLRAGVERMQGRKLDVPVLPVHPALAALLPGGGLRPGAAYSLAPSTSLLLALLAGASQTGAWCGAVGMPDLGAEAAERLGVDLSRLVLIPDPGPRWLAVTATVSEVLPVVAVRPSSRVSDGEVSRLAARLRDRGAVLLVQGSWPQAEAVLELGKPEWSGLGRGHGYLSGREVTVTSSSRRWPVPRRGRMLLPAADGTLQSLPPVVSGAASIPGAERAAAVAATGFPRDETRHDYESAPLLEAVG